MPESFVFATRQRIRTTPTSRPCLAETEFVPARARAPKARPRSPHHEKEETLSRKENTILITGATLRTGSTRASTKRNGCLEFRSFARGC
jgi:hypothetical protein